MNKFLIKPAEIITLIVTFLMCSANAFAADSCPDAKLLSGKLFSDICWDCMFPIKVAGVAFGSGDVPEDSVSDRTCSCDDNLGVPHPGFVTGMWEPARVIEVVRGSGCSPSLGGVRLPLSDIRKQGTGGKSKKISAQEGAFYQYHYFAFPLLVMLELFMDESCSVDGYSDFDLMYFSEVDPTWNNEQLAFFTHPEAAAVANPVAISACSTDAVAATAGKPQDKMFWCAGSWGQLYPFSGHHSATGSFAQNTNLIATRAVASIHRRGLARRTIGKDSLCKGTVAPMLPKSQYKLNFFFPTPEAQSSHLIGENDAKWGANRKIPGAGEDAVLILSRYNDCCVVF